MKTLAPLFCVSFLLAAMTARAADSLSGSDILKRVPQLKTFFEAKEKQARADVKKLEQDVSPDFWAFFKAAQEGKWAEADSLWKSLSRRAGQYQGPNGEAPPPPDEKVCHTAPWPCALEVVLALELFRDSNPKFPETLGRAMVDCIPRGAIYFGGTDPGRGLPTALSKSHADADPFFTLTQNALADGSYLEYLRRMYGAKITLPTADDAQKAFQEYLADAQRRLDHDKNFPSTPKQIKPGEDVRVIDNRVQVSGQVAVMAINGLLSKIIFDKNPTREFYVEESFPLDWMYPHLSPHGFIMQLHRESLASLPLDAIDKDHDFWNAQCKKLLGKAVTSETSVKEVCDFVGKVYIDKNLSWFTGDPDYVKDESAQKTHSKLRSSIAGIYTWRLNSSPKDKDILEAEADYAFKQAFALCPYSPEAVFRFVNFLVSRGTQRMDDAIAVVNTAVRIDPSNVQMQQLKQELQRIKKVQGAKQPR